MSMIYPTSVSLSMIGGLFNGRSAHLLAFAYSFGLNTWQTFAGGILAYKALPRINFRNLQNKIFPIYFLTNSIAAAVMLGSQVYRHPLKQSIFTLSSPESFQAVSLGLNLAFYVLNALWIGPLTTKVMFQRAKLEKEEGKSYSDDGISEEMKVLNSSFSKLHGVSSLLNLGALIVTTVHGLWIANYGL
ncbi:Uncharacterized conserved protein [Phaffia rhodozyma]|uniref:Uncharacterized conserved protein n=1 Tax=Phaffia rhodozyma TaxID=264483 RepID=A0A0F7SU50_PHARH|nr:Uncharacterized conserved protein [Phaffia rhodozyma]